MARFFTVLALSGSLLGFAAPAAAAETQPLQYRAELAAPAPVDRLVVRDVVWRCGGEICVAPAANSRPALVCAALARHAGALRSFTAEGRRLPSDELEKCNARAR